MLADLLRASARGPDLRGGAQLHGSLTKLGFGTDTMLGNNLIDMYAKCGRLDLAQRVFDGLEHRNLATWNSLVAGHASAGQFDRALELVETMKRHRLDPNVTTWNGLITGYAMNGLSSQAMLLLRQIKAAGVAPNVVSWTSLISGSCHSGDYQGSFTFFSEMQQDGVQPSLVTMLVLLRACAGLAHLNKGKELHCFALRRAYDGEVVVSTALVDMYAKAGSLTSAKRVFGRVQGRNLVCCNAMLTGLAVHGQAHEAAALFHDMWRSGLKPDGITFTAVLPAC